MGLFDNIKQVSKEAKKQVKKKTADVKKQLDEEFGGDDNYTKFKESSSSAFERSKCLGKDVISTAQEITGEIGETEIGKNIGELSRSISTKLADLPVLSITGDVVKQKNGVNNLLEYLKEDTNDPERYIWLAEAMIRSNLDIQNYSRIRSAVDPSYFMIQNTVKSMNDLGKVEKDLVTIKLLKTAFSLSLGRIQKNPRDAKALYCLARIYHCQGDNSEAIKYAKLSFLAKQSALPLITLAKCYLNIGQVSNAEKAAHKSLKWKSSYGNKILAECKMLDDKTSKDSLDKLRRYSILVDRVKPKDEAKYYGPKASSINLLEGVGKQQWERITKLME